jgi:hypothetical protein
MPSPNFSGPINDKRSLSLDPAIGRSCAGTWPTYNKTMIEIKLINQNPKFK